MSLNQIDWLMSRAVEELDEERMGTHYFETAIHSDDSLTIFSIEKLEKMLSNAVSRYSQTKILELLKNESNRKPLRMVDEGILDSIDLLKSKFANFSLVIDVIKKELTLAALNKPCPIQLAPLLLVGPPGVGKTYFLNSLAHVFGLPFTQIDMAAMSAGFVLAGSSSSWAEGKPGNVSNALRASIFANPVILLDELDKSTGSRDYEAAGSLYSLLERDTAKKFKDECLDIEMDCSGILWFASANDLELIPAPIQSRMRVIHVDPPTEEMMPIICESVYRELLTTTVWGKFFDPLLDFEIMKILTHQSPRQIKRILYDACCNAVQRGATDIITLEPNDIVIEHAVQRKRIGFL